jgi:hypothetical protein
MKSMNNTVTNKDLPCIEIKEIKDVVKDITEKPKNDVITE